MKKTAVEPIERKNGDTGSVLYIDGWPAAVRYCEFISDTYHIVARKYWETSEEYREIVRDEYPDIIEKANKYDDESLVMMSLPALQREVIKLIKQNRPCPLYEARVEE